ncbi:GNAT family N-acetyltransferase [Tomitella gaofuii]|uniref:GNAT family N-acetyltransferase n=1 Tax=Tomitella gaofuii TaxID=2760083 RepID=UPI0015F9DC8E|nr:GNAT family N-acetyltransferase [Tomitella gaofuii]
MTGVAVTMPAPRERWRGIVAASDTALPEQVPEWVDAVCASKRYTDLSRLYVFDDGTEAVLPLVRRRGPAGIGGSLQSFPPAWGIGGLLSARALSARQVRDVLGDLRRQRAQRVWIRPDPVAASAWRAAAGAAGATLVPRRAHVLELAPGRDAVWAGLSQTGRRNVRLARRSGVEVVSAHSGALLDEYYGLFLSSVDRWAEHQHEPRPLARARARRRDPLAKLAAMGKHLGEDFVVTLCRVDGVAVAGVVVLYGRTAHGTRAAMDRERLGRSHASELACWTSIELALERGCTAFHMGESGGSTELARAKEKFGAHPVDYAEVRLERLPWTRADGVLRAGVKRVIGFRDD